MRIKFSAEFEAELEDGDGERLLAVSDLWSDAVGEFVAELPEAAPSLAVGALHGEAIEGLDENARQTMDTTPWGDDPDDPGNQA